MNSWGMIQIRYFPSGYGFSVYVVKLLYELVCSSHTLIWTQLSTLIGFVIRAPDLGPDSAKFMNTNPVEDLIVKVYS